MGSANGGNLDVQPVYGILSVKYAATHIPACLIQHVLLFVTDTKIKSILTNVSRVVSDQLGQ